MSETAPTNVTTSHRFPCTACGADYRFDPAQDRLACDHCGHTEEIGLTRGPSIRELDFEDALQAKLPAQDIEETRVSQCPNCAAEVEFDAHTHAAECPFCATPVVTDTGLQDYARKGRAMSGIYVPYWTFDADTTSRYSGERGTVYYDTITVVRDGKRERQQVAKIRWSPARGRVARFFDDVLVLASRSLPKRFTDALEPWDLAALEPYRPEYLAGFRAEGYSVELSEGYEEARTHMARVIERDVKFDIGGDRQRIHDIDTSVKDVTFKHILLPVWLAAYKYRGRSFRFVVNGRTGRVQGERPYSAWKIFFAVLLGLIIAGTLGYLYGLEQGAF